MTADVNHNLVRASRKAATASLRLFQQISQHLQLLVLVAVALVVVLGLLLTVVTGQLLMQPEMRLGGGLFYVALLFLMWWSMMLAMMLPSAIPAILTYGAIGRKISVPFSNSHVLAFAGGYAAVWSLFSIGAALLQILTYGTFHLTGMMAVSSQLLGATLLIAAGLYQVTPLKQACLRKCQMPLMYLARNWRKGLNGAFRMGFSHGLYCVGCCFVLMGLLFYGGVMELSWIIGLAVFVALEKVLPARGWISKLSGVALIGWGLVLLSKAMSA